MNANPPAPATAVARATVGTPPAIGAATMGSGDSRSRGFGMTTVPSQLDGRADHPAVARPSRSGCTVDGRAPRRRRELPTDPHLCFPDMDVELRHLRAFVAV